jgi:hypothetical protein
VSKREEPDWLAELAKNMEALRRQIDQGGETLRRQVELLGRAAEQFVRGARRPTPGIDPVPPFQRRVVRAADAMMRELLPPREPVVHHVALYDTGAGLDTLAVSTVTGTASATGVGTVTASGSVALPPMRTGLAAMSDGQIVFLVLVWLYAIWLPWFGSRLPPELHGMLSDSLATFAIALSITWRIRDKHR